MPERIQRKRTKGWRMPENTVYVGRPTVWANRNTVEMYGYDLAKHLFISDLERGTAGWPGIGKGLTHEMIRRELRGKNLACWCPLDEPCHADVLLKLANADDARRERE